MQWFGETPPASVSGPLGLVIKRALEQDAPEPTGWVFLDSEGLWRDAMARLSLAERRSCVVVALDDEELVAATRWSIGGCVLLPPSLLRVSAAGRAAGEASVLQSWTAYPEVVAEISCTKDNLRVGFQPREIWEAMVGLRGQLEMLAALADVLGRPAVIGPGPSLMLTGVDGALIKRAWEKLETRPQWAAGSRLLKIGDSNLDANDGFEDMSWPVAHWPSRRAVARWKLDVANTKCPWRLETDGGTALETGAVSTQIELERATADILRIYGVPSSDLERKGSPGAVVVEALARQADRTGHTLWIPGVTRNAGAVIRGWGLGVWVDGPVLAPPV